MDREENKPTHRRRALRAGTPEDYYRSLSHDALLRAFEKIDKEMKLIDALMRDEYLSPDDKVALYAEKNIMWKRRYQ